MSNDLHICPDCNRLAATQPDSLCASCSSWCEQKFSELHDDWQDKLARRKRFRPFGAMSGADFGEALADIAKAVERSRLK
jgi:hypothetical protein